MVNLYDELVRTPELLERLSKKYPSPAYAFMPQVRSATGYGDTRTADALAMGLWPSRGIHLTGFELKVSRSDWLHELKNPAKAEEIAKFCDFWYLVVSKEEIVQIDEVPESWGLMAAIGRGGAIKVIKKAEPLKPIQLDRTFLASICRNVTEKMIPESVVSDRIKDAQERARESVSYDLDRLKEVVAEFEKASGVEINEYKAGHIGEAVDDVLKGRHKHAKRELKAVREKVAKLLKYIDGEVDDTW